jgi:uncharacterized FAD-dependent dehydrogenase
MLIKISNIRLPLDSDASDLRNAVFKKLRAGSDQPLFIQPIRKAVDARDRNRIHFVYTVEADIRGKVRFSKDVAPAAPCAYRVEGPGSESLAHRPIVTGAGPGGLFAALLLARAGYRPLVLERGKSIEERRRDVRRFLETGTLSPESNIPFGEGGAGAFSDGKLSTGIHDPRCREVLRILTEAGAPEEITYLAKPHLGTDRLPHIVSKLSRMITASGGEIRFSSRLTRLRSEYGRLTGAQINSEEWLPASVLILAVGHSAGDTYETLYEQNILMAPKAFSAGVRIEHPQAFIDERQYGAFAGHPALGAADYRLSCRLPSGRGVYTFCMCPGGSVVPAATEAGGVVVNGMSPWHRDGANANSALLVSVAPEDLKSAHPLAGLFFRRELERAAYQAGGGGFRAPAQRLEDFLAGRATRAPGAVKPTYLPGVVLADLAGCLPEFITESLRESIPILDRQLPGFALPDALLTAVETRSSAPVRILRDSRFESNLRGLIPCGEGAGYAGGIMSADADGLRCAEAVIRRYRLPTPANPSS